MLLLLTLRAGDTSQGVPRSTRPRWTASSSCPPVEAAMWQYVGTTVQPVVDEASGPFGVTLPTSYLGGCLRKLISHRP